MSNTKNKKKIIIWTSVIIAIVLAIIIACVIYLNTYYRADWSAINTYMPTSGIEFVAFDEGFIVEPQSAHSGFIFYPGGKVEAASYLPLMESCASKGILCVLLEMPFNLAVFDINAANGIKEMFPNIEKWYIGGHSLGGSMAASYLENNYEEFDGLILLGSYSTINLSKTNLKVLSVFGSEDRVMNKEKYDDNKGNLPSNFTEIIIDGGNHAFFGMYGAQDGDGMPTISNEEQILITAEEILNIIKQNG